MAQCPVCMANVSDDFGLIECANCAAQLIVHMDGRVEHSGAQVSAGTGEDEPPPLPPPVDENFAFGFPMAEIDPAVLAQANEPTIIRETRSILSEPPPPSEEPMEVPGDELAEAPTPGPGEFTFANAVENVAPENVAPEIVAGEPTPADSPDLSDIARFGNSDISGGRDGSLRYNLFVSGIDTSDVREAFREAITDRKLVWDTDQILRSLKNGEVRIAGVPPAKAYLVVSRLRSLPVQVRWEQYAVSQG